MATEKAKKVKKSSAEFSENENPDQKKASKKIKEKKAKSELETVEPKKSAVKKKKNTLKDNTETTSGRKIKKAKAAPAETTPQNVDASAGADPAETGERVSKNAQLKKSHFSNDVIHHLAPHTVNEEAEVTEATIAKEVPATSSENATPTVSTVSEGDNQTIKDDISEKPTEVAGEEINPANLPEETIGDEELASGELSVTIDNEDFKEETRNILKTIFRVKFSTKIGQQLFVTGNHELLGNNDLSKALPMQYFNQDYWTAEVELPKDLNQEIVYNYYLKFDDGSDTIEWGNDKVINPSQIITNQLLLTDTWNYAGFYENTFYAEPFKQVLLNENYTPVETSSLETFTHTFKVKAPLLPKGHVLFISGNIPELRNWDVTEPLLLSRKHDEDWWSIKLDLTNASFPIDYKYGVYNVEENKLVQFETGANRLFDSLNEPAKQNIVHDGFAYLPNNTFKGAGVAIPVFSLRSENSFGVGEFNDLKLLVNWAKKVGLKLIQILPINDTTATYTFADSYPYAAISAFALHPLYLNLSSVVNKENQEMLTSITSEHQQLNSLPTVNYSRVLELKLAFIKELFPLQKEATFNTPDFEEFFDSNSHWLVPYAAFSYLRDRNNTADFSNWSTNQTYNEAEISALTKTPLSADEAVSIHYFIQYHLHLQLKAAAEYAHQNGIIVKGDIPIGIFRNSCDAWQEPQLYNMNQQAGAPPDDFAVKGQNWGFPTYNWQQMALDGFSWWKRRFKQMSYYFDAFRIDHILGFFRIWSIPMDAVEGILGHFVPAVPVHITEFQQRGIWYDLSRFTKPFITDAVLWQLFVNESLPVKKQFLKELENGNYELLPEFDTQRKVEQYFTTVQQSGFNKSLQQGLFDLISNVILFEAEGSQGQQFHFRISVESTTSFQHLDEGTKYHIRELYINYFFRRQDNFWKTKAMKKLPELKRSTNMLICGEDLGMVPSTVPGVMKDLAILSLEIQRMPKDPTVEFFHPNQAPYLSVVTPSTHDMSTIRGWWEEDTVKTQRFFNTQIGQSGNAPFFCEPWINWIIILQHLYSPAMWSIFQLQDILGIDAKLRRQNPHDERINVPANPKHYWQYRMHLNLEELLEENNYNEEFKQMVAASGRS